LGQQLPARAHVVSLLEPAVLPGNMQVSQAAPAGFLAQNSSH